MKERLIEKAEYILSLQEPTESDTCRLFNIVRKLLEQLPKKDLRKYRQLHFYCDWVVHSLLDRNTAGAKLLERIDEIYWSSATKQEKDKLMIGAFSLAEVQSQMIHLFRKIDEHFPHPGQPWTWMELRSHLISIISDCPLNLGKNKYTSHLPNDNAVRHRRYISQITLKRMRDVFPDTEGYDNIPVIELTFVDKREDPMVTMSYPLILH